MRLEDLLEQKKDIIKKRWLELIVETYPAETRAFFKKQKNRFSNPIGAALAKLVDGLYDGLYKGTGSREITAALDDFVKIRAVQEFAPSQAIAFILYLKQAIRDVLVEDIKTSQHFSELQHIEARIDRLLLEAFDIYMASRETLYKIKADELKRQSYLALKMMHSDPARRDRGDNSNENS